MLTCGLLPLCSSVPAALSIVNARLYSVSPATPASSVVVCARSPLTCACLSLLSRLVASSGWPFPLVQQLSVSNLHLHQLLAQRTSELETLQVAMDQAEKVRHQQERHGHRGTQDRTQ